VIVLHYRGRIFRRVTYLRVPALRALRVARRMRVSRRGCDNDEEKEEAAATMLMTNVRYLAN